MQWSWVSPVHDGAVPDMAAEPTGEMNDHVNAYASFPGNKSMNFIHKEDRGKIISLNQILRLRSVCHSQTEGRRSLPLFHRSFVNSFASSTRVIDVQTTSGCPIAGYLRCVSIDDKDPTLLHGRRLL
jgi:hypothetical protein